MKHRAGFVSNSSSSSFIIDKRYITPEQIERLEEYIREDCEGGWNIAGSDEDFIRGYTIMDNGDLRGWIKESMGDVQLRAIVSWEGD